MNTRATPEPVAPTPSPDIAGLVERAKNYVNDPDQLEHCDPKYLSDDLEEFATALQRVAQEREKLQHEVEMLTTAGIIEVAVRNPSVMDYMRHWEARAEAAEARIATARDEGLEDAALLIDSVQIPSAPLAAERFAAAIRALKGQLT